MISDDLKAIYSSNTRDLYVLETAEISHPLFQDTFRIVKDNEPHELEDENGVLHHYTPYGFNVVLPEKGGKQVDIAFTFDNVLRFPIEQLRRASEDYRTPITLIYRVYIKGLSTPQSTALRLNLNDISIDDTVVTARASRVDIATRNFPNGKGIFIDNRFKGIS